MPLSSPTRDAPSLPRLAIVFIAVLVIGQGPMLAGADLAVVSLYDRRRNDLLNTWGGAWRAGGTKEVTLRSGATLSGVRALCLDLGPVKAGEDRYLQCFACGFGPTREYYQTRDLTPYARLDFRLQNATRVPLRGSLQVKDYRDSLEQRAVYPFQLPASAGWTDISVPLEFAAAPWQLKGRPDLSRVLAIDFHFAPQATLTSGRIYLADVALAERAGPLDIDTSPLPLLVERLARRQWQALWAARDRTCGLIPNNSYQSTDAGLNTTAAMLWMLPAATRRHWVEPGEADGYVALLVHTVDRLLDRARYVPPRNMDWITLKPSLLPEESVVDAAFLELAFHQYKSLSSTSPALRGAITRTEARFDFSSFACPAGWRMAYRYPSSYCREGFTAGTYDGYTNEANLTSLAAYLTPGHGVPIERHWNSSTKRVRAGLAAAGALGGSPLMAAGVPGGSLLVGAGRGPLVHSLREFRAPFGQALWNLFIDVRSRGVDTYPDGRLAANPWQNFVCYEQDVMDSLARAGRPYLVQPDAGDDGTLVCYRQFSVYDDFGQGDLFMPWSTSFPLLAGVDRAGDSLRFLLRHGLHDPFGLADSAKWTTGDAEPYAVAARHDFWNTSLATMALLEYLDQEASSSRSFAALPEIRAALDRVFPATARTGAAPPPAAVGRPAS